MDDASIFTINLKAPRYALVDEWATYGFTPSWDSDEENEVTGFQNAWNQFYRWDELPENAQQEWTSLIKSYVAGEGRYLSGTVADHDALLALRFDQEPQWSAEVAPHRIVGGPAGDGKRTSQKDKHFLATVIPAPLQALREALDIREEKVNALVGKGRFLPDALEKHEPADFGLENIVTVNVLVVRSVKAHYKNWLRRKDEEFTYTIDVLRWVADLDRTRLQDILHLTKKKLEVKHLFGINYTSHAGDLRADAGQSTVDRTYFRKRGFIGAAWPNKLKLEDTINSFPFAGKDLTKKGAATATLRELGVKNNGVILCKQLLDGNKLTVERGREAKGFKELGVEAIVETIL